MRDALIELREYALAVGHRMRTGHERCPEAELWLVLAYVIERILAAHLC